jgi:hypothetical protein
VRHLKKNQCKGAKKRKVYSSYIQDSGIHTRESQFK